MHRKLLLLPRKMLMIFYFLNVECCKCTSMRFHCANGLAVV